MRLFIIVIFLIHTTKTDRIKLITHIPEYTKMYNFFPLCKNHLEFTVKTSKDISILLSNEYRVAEPYYEISISDYFSVLKKDSPTNYKAKYDKKIIYPELHQTFSITLNDTEGSISVEKSHGEVILYHQDPGYVKMSYFGVWTGYNTTGFWDFDADLVNCN